MGVALLEYNILPVYSVYRSHNTYMLYENVYKRICAVLAGKKGNATGSSEGSSDGSSSDIGYNVPPI